MMRKYSRPRTLIAGWITPCFATPLPARFETTLELDWPVDGLEPLAFLLGRVLEPLCASLAGRGARSFRLASSAVTPAVAISEDGAIYSVFFDAASKDVLLRASRDGGASFSPPAVAIATKGAGRASRAR